MEGESPVAEAMRWVSSITTVGAMMVLPALCTQWAIDRWALDTRIPRLEPWLVPAALAFGFASGMYYLLALVHQANRSSADRGPTDQRSNSPNTNPPNTNPQGSKPNNSESKDAASQDQSSGDTADT